MQETYNGMNGDNRIDIQTEAKIDSEGQGVATKQFSEQGIDDLFNEIMMKKLDEQKMNLKVDIIAEMR